MNKNIKVIDLFAGPGGLGEGFSSFEASKNEFPFNIKLSVEMDPNAHKTLTLRAFYRKFRGKTVPNAYYDYLRDEELTTDYLKEKYPKEWNEALNETMNSPKELGTEDDKEIFKLLKELKSAEPGPYVVIGGPPCQAYSVMGRIKNNSLDDYVAEKDHRHYLYRDYLKVLHAIEPEVFVMENVKGILTSKLDGEAIFPMILDDLKCPSQALGKRKGARYHIYSLARKPDFCDKDGTPNYSSNQDYVIKSENYGIPQNRHRVILLGVRSDMLEENEAQTLSVQKSISVADAIGGMARLRSAVSRQKDDAELWYNTVIEQGNELIEVLKKANQHIVAKNVNKTLTNLSLPIKHRGNKRFLKTNSIGLNNLPKKLNTFYHDTKLDGLLNHFARSHMPSDLKRYLFCSEFAKVNWRRAIPSPSKRDFPEELAPNHKSWETGKFSDRFRVQFKLKPSSTITSHINRDGHYFIHYDPSQCRSLTVREAARLQTFPDNYFFEGNQTQQYIQVGNAVPPFLAAQIAQVVFNIIS